MLAVSGALFLDPQIVVGDAGCKHVLAAPTAVIAHVINVAALRDRKPCRAPTRLTEVLAITTNKAGAWPTRTYRGGEL